jgi:HK97 gp10 family phage protein
MKAKNRTGKSGAFLDMDHRKLLKTFSEEVQGRVVRSAVGAASTAIRKQAKKNINKVGPLNTTTVRYVGKDGYEREYETTTPGSKIGRSKKTGTWEKLERAQKTKRLARLAASMPRKKDPESGMPVAEFGPKMGAIGKSGISDWMMTKYKKYKRGKTWVGVTGPAHRVAAQAHILEFGARHFAWGKPSAPLPPRPFLRPAAQQTRSEQRSKIIKVMKRWQKKDL